MNSPSNKFQSLMLWSAGYSPVTARRFHPDEVVAVAKKGPVVLLAAIVATVSWAIAGWTRGMEDEPIARLIGSIVAGGVGAGVVLALDRFFIFKSDTTEFSGVGRASWIMVRLVLSLAMASLTAEALTPWLFRSGLLTTATAMTEEAEAARTLDLERRLGVASKKTDLEHAAAAVVLARTAITVIPPPVRAAQIASESCLATNANQHKALFRLNGEDAAFGSKLGLTAHFGAKCEKLELRASELQQQFLAIGNANVTTAVNSQESAAKALAASEQTVQDRLQIARAKDLLALTPASTAVQARFFEHDVKAQWVSAGAKLLITLVEFCPLLLQMIGGRSKIGIAIDLETRARSADREAGLLDKSLSGELKRFESQLAIDGLAVAARSKKLRQTSSANMADYLMAAGPIVNIGRFADLVDAQRPDAHRSAYRSAAFSDAVADGTDILRTGISGKHVH